MEMASAGYFRKHSPARLWIVAYFLIIGLPVQGNIDQPYITDHFIVNQLFQCHKIRQRSPVVRHKHRYSCLAPQPVDLGTFLIISCHGLFYIHRLTGSYSFRGILKMDIRRRSNIDGIHTGIVDQVIHISIPARYMMPFCIIRCFFRFPRHYRHQRSMRHFIDRRSAAFSFGNISATYHSPVYFSHKQSFYMNDLLPKKLNDGNIACPFGYTAISHRLFNNSYITVKLLAEQSNI